MAKVHVCNVLVLGNPSRFDSKLELEITFECVEDLPEDLEWKIIYVGSAESEEYDQILDTVYVGPVPEGRHKFVFEADPPDPLKIPASEVVGVTVILLTCSYRTNEFIRVGYYVSNEYTDPELQENPPDQPQFHSLQRNILASNPRVTKFKINWDGTKTNDEQQQMDTTTSSSQAPKSAVQLALEEANAKSLAAAAANATSASRNEPQYFPNTGIQIVTPALMREINAANDPPPPSNTLVRNPLPPFKNPEFFPVSPLKMPQSSYNRDYSHLNHNSNSDNLMEREFGK